MANLTLAQWEEIRDNALTELTNAMKSEAYTRSDVSNRRNLAEIRATLELAERNIARLTRGGIRITGGTPT